MRSKQTITIRNRTYTFTGISIRSGGRADILKLEAQGQLYALKVFRQEFYQRYTHTKEMERYQILQGIRGYEWVTQRIMLNPDEDAELIATHDLLHNAVLMPWFDDNSWNSWSVIKYKVINNEITMPPQSILNTVATNIAQAISELSDSAYAHGDVNDNNVLINIADGSVVFIDIEDMFDQRASDVGAAGTNGYRFNQSYTAWDIHADRFSTALFISEIVGFAETVKQGNIRYEGYFTQDEIDKRDTNSEHYRWLTQALQQINANIHALFTQVWQAPSLDQCPGLYSWREVLSRLVVSPPPAPNVSTPNPPSQVVLKGDNTARYTPRSADSNFPALIVFMLDYSQSMVNMEMGNARNQKRADRMFELVGEILYELKSRSEKGSIVAPRYHVAFFAYGKTCINVLQLFDQILPSVPESEIQDNMPARGLGIWQLPTLIKLIAGQGKDIQDFFKTHYADVAQRIDTGDTYMTEAFLQVKELLKPELMNEYQACAAPMLIHITDGFNMDPRDVVPVFNELRRCGTEYGDLLVSTTYIGPNIIDLPADLRTWQGVGPDTLFKREYINNGRLLSSISSPIPDTIRHTINNDNSSTGQRNYALAPGSRLLFPGNQESMIKLSLTAASATVARSVH
jgi:hypothetical protein